MTVYKTNENIVCRSVHDSYFLIDIKDNYADDKCRLFEINEIGHIIWCGLKKYPSDQINCIANEIAQKLVDDIDIQIICDDISEYISILKENGFIMEGDQ